MPIAARTVFNEAVKEAKKPEKLAFGMIISCLDVINTFSDELELIRAEDVEVIFNFIRAFPSM